MEESTLPEKVLEPHDGRFSINGRCPGCGHAIAMRIVLDLQKPSKLGLDAATIANVDALLGKMSDREIALQTGVSYAWVSNRRRALVIPRYSVINNADLWRNVDPLFVDHRDSEILSHPANVEAGFSLAQIRNRRLSLGIKQPAADERRTTHERIFKLHDMGFDMSAIGAAVRLTRQRVEQILRTKERPTDEPTKAEN